MSRSGWPGRGRLRVDRRRQRYHRRGDGPARRSSGVIRELLRGLSAVLLIAGTIVLADVGATLLWQEPVTALIAKLRQDDLANQLDRAPLPTASPVQRRALAEIDGDRAQLAFLARRYKRELRRGEAAGRIRIRKIGVNKVVVFGTDHDDLTKGPGFYPSQPLPGAPGTAAIAGHRTTYGAPFRKIDRLRRGDPIDVELPYGRFRYRVLRLRSVTPDSVWVLRRRSYDQLILSACDPPFSAARRLIVFAKLERGTVRRAGDTA
ncbi:class E sortase [Patulibacter defluvii]|uniref:class E sortase n=1 Tax=Patulibacter defluvii TaxID=3095358 RepID=UPI002A756BEA|nr:class E sortase [Patulibacter sp. DM4]